MCVYVQLYWYDSNWVEWFRGGVDKLNKDAHRFYAVVLFGVPLQPSANFRFYLVLFLPFVY